MAVLYNFTNVYAIAFAFNAVASYIQNRRDQHLHSITDEISVALDTYQISGTFVSERRQLRDFTQRYIRRIRICSLLMYTLIVLDCLLALLFLIFSGLYPTYEMSDVWFISMIAVMLGLPLLTWFIFSVFAANAMKHVRSKVDHVVRGWEAAGLNKEGGIHIDILGQRLGGIAALRNRPKRSHLVDIILRYARRLRGVVSIELDSDSTNIIARLENKYGKEPEETAREALAFLELIVRSPDRILIVKDADGSVVYSISHQAIIDGLRAGKRMEDILPSSPTPLAEHRTSGAPRGDGDPN